MFLNFQRMKIKIIDSTKGKVFKNPFSLFSLVFFITNYSEVIPDANNLT